MQTPQIKFMMLILQLKASGELKVWNLLKLQKLAGIVFLKLNHAFECIVKHDTKALHGKETTLWIPRYEYSNFTRIV
jgi:hypothetical protein